MGNQKPEPQGTLDMLVLKALSLGPMHGYGVGQRIGQLAEEMLKVEEGTLYPALYRIEQRGWIKSEWGYRRINGGRVSTSCHAPAASSWKWNRRSGRIFHWPSARCCGRPEGREPWAG
jgi:hypothetical protein